MPQSQTIEPVHMVDLKGQYARIQQEIDEAILEVVRSSRYIKGPVVQAFEDELADYLQVKHAIGCANGTDALQIALMALDLNPGDEVIVPAFTYVATAEVIGLLGLTPVMVDVDPADFNIRVDAIKAAITAKSRAIIPVHLFGQSAPMARIMQIAENHDLYVIEDNAQAIGTHYIYPDGRRAKAGTIGHIGTTSFFPSKNLGCYGDGGALFTNDEELAERIRMIANHGQSRQYYHDQLGVNSRLDAIQAAVLRVKLPYLDDYCASRRSAADHYDASLAELPQVETPYRATHSTHVFHQYTLKVPPSDRMAVQDYLKEHDVPSMIYYPLPLYRQKAYAGYWGSDEILPVCEDLCQRVLSLPIHTELTPVLQDHITDLIKAYFS